MNRDQPSNPSEAHWCVYKALTIRIANAADAEKKPTYAIFTTLHEKQGNEPSDYKVEKPPSIDLRSLFAKSFPKAH